MFRHRLALEADHYRLPEPPAPAITPAGFQICPIGVLCTCTDDQISGIKRLYQWAFDEATSVVQPAIVERELFAAPN